MVNEPLYCYRLDEKTFLLEKKTITDYEIVKTNYLGRKRYKIGNHQINRTQKIYWLEEAKLDRFVSGKVFTFTDDDSRAYDIVLGDVMDRMITHRKRLVGAETLYNSIVKAKNKRKNNEYKEEP